MLNNKNKFIHVLGAVIISSAMTVSCSSSYTQESTGQYIDSSVITTKVKAELLADKEISGLPITVKTYKNTVQLSGFVNNTSQKIKAEQIARSVKGVEYVQDSLIIKSR